MTAIWTTWLASALGSSVGVVGVLEWQAWRQRREARKRTAEFIAHIDHPPENAGGELPPDDPDGGLHTPSWLTLRELQANRERLQGMQVLEAIVELERLGCPPDDVRMVFAFDN